MFEGFAATEIDAGEATIFVRHSGIGLPLLLLHGYAPTFLPHRTGKEPR